MTFEELGIHTKSGATRYYTTCPKCNDSRKKHKNAPCLTVNDEPGNRWYKCHHCNFSGNLDIQDKYKLVLENSKMPKQQAATFSTEVREYFKSRGIDPAIAIREKVFEYSNRGKPVVGFPAFINMTMVNVKYLNVRYNAEEGGLKWWQMNKEYGSKAIFWGMQSIRFEENDEMQKKRIVIITEGEIDTLTWKQCGYNNAISVPQGAPSPKAKNFTDEFNYVEDPYVQSFFHPDNVDLIVFSTDNDEPGKFLREHLVHFFGKVRCRYINYPVGYKDINEVYNGDKKKNLPALGKKGVDECFNNLSTFAVAGVIKLYDVIDELNQYSKNGFLPGYGTGISYVDRLFTLKPKHITFVTGVPGAGKSVFIRWYLAQFVRHNEKENLKWAMFTPENRPVSREYAKLAEVLAGQRLQEGFANSMSEEKKQKVYHYISKHFFVVSPDRNNFETFNGKIQMNQINTLNSILEYLIHLKKTEDIFGYVIDAWNKIEHEQPKWMPETSFISQQLDYLINFNDTYNVHGIIIVHPRKVDLQSDMNYKMPSLYDIKGSSAWKEKADIGILVHRNKLKRRPKHEITDDMDEEDKYYTDKSAPTIVRTEKIRFEEIGEEGSVKLSMDFAKGGSFSLFEPKKDNAEEAPKYAPNNINRYEGKQNDDDFVIQDEDKEDLPF
ncbi:MAG: hypothetical protein BWY95_00056 [Bacteroidetes bacterium ADurb.BinA104]|nr:MAG: hypothetical protein BWY95_00056 [Bacteroidetes bacterium ADurb.BinA104]